jgi:hypothetical protein
MRRQWLIADLLLQLSKSIWGMERHVLAQCLQVISNRHFPMLPAIVAQINMF